MMEEMNPPAAAALPDLLRRVEAAKGADRELHYLIWGALQGVRQSVPADLGFYRGSLRYPDWEVGGPSVTASLDAALALCERTLPGWEWARGMDGEMVLFKGYWTDRHVGRAKTPALALLSALLRALIAQEPSGG